MFVSISSSRKYESDRSKEFKNIRKQTCRTAVPAAGIMEIESFLIIYYVD